MAGLSRRLAAQRARLARSLRVDHGLPARLAARRQGRHPAAASTAASRSTACTSGWAPTRTRSRCCASATPNSTEPTTDPAAPIQTWDEAMIPADNPGLADQWGDDWLTWLGTHLAQRHAARRSERHRPRDDRGGLRRSGRCNCVLDFADSLRDATPTVCACPHNPPPAAAAAVRSARCNARCSPHSWRSAIRESRARPPVRRPRRRRSMAIRDAIDYEHRPDHRRSPGCCCRWSPQWSAASSPTTW